MPASFIHALATCVAIKLTLWHNQGPIHQATLTTAELYAP